jgi:hypothetical protein
MEDIAFVAHLIEISMGNPGDSWRLEKLALQLGAYSLTEIGLTGSLECPRFEVGLFSTPGERK